MEGDTGNRKRRHASEMVYCLYGHPVGARVEIECKSNSEQLMIANTILDQKFTVNKFERCSYASCLVSLVSFPYVCHDLFFSAR